LVSFRERYEIQKEYTDVSFTGEPGRLRYTDTNTKTRVGYSFGFKKRVFENLDAGVTFRSGVGSVMWQDINSNGSLLPGLLEAYIDWRTPYAELLLGKIPQKGNVFWDLYTCANLREDWRLYNPTDGVFNDRLGALNGMRLSVPVGPVTVRMVYHADYVGGYARDYPEETNLDDERDLDWQVFVLGAEVRKAGFDLDVDVGLPKRRGNRYRRGRDSGYVDEFIWGGTLRKEIPDLYGTELQIGYAYNSRDSIFTASFVDAIASAQVAGFRLTGRYQIGIQDMEFGIYKGYRTKRAAYHLYFNKEVWHLDIQPRLIWFRTEVAGNRKMTNLRLEVTSTVRF